MEREIVCYWGTTGMGKSRRAWEEAGLTLILKIRGVNSGMDIEVKNTLCLMNFEEESTLVILRWFDRYPVIVEVKGSSTVLKAKKIWITSNLHPNDWYPELDQETKSALIRRLTIVHFVNPLI